MPKDITRHVTVKSSRELEADQFHVGDVWESPRGVRYGVFRVIDRPCMRVAYMVSESTQRRRTVDRVYDDLGCDYSKPWVRISARAGGKS